MMHGEVGKGTRRKRGTFLGMIVGSLLFWPGDGMPAEGPQDSRTSEASTGKEQQETKDVGTGGPSSTDPTKSTSAPSLISEDQLAGLPLSGRSYSQLATLEAGVSDTSTGTSSSRGVGGGSLTVSGARPTSNHFLLDGTSIMNTGNQVPRSAAGVQLGSDAVSQVQVFSGNYSAEYGWGSGGVLNSITRSGSNEFHGTAFEFLRNSKLDARNFFDAGPEPPPFKRNQFGFMLTGPLRREGTYFMGSFEAMRDRLAETDVSYFPDELARRGIITKADGTEVTRCADPTAVPFCVSPRVRDHLALYPIPNAARVGEGIGENRAPQFLPTDENFFVVRVDHKVSERDSLFFRYTFDDATSFSTGTTYLFRQRNKSRQQYLTLLGAHIFSLSVLNSVRLGYTRPIDSLESVASIEIPRALFFVPDAPQFGLISIPGLSAFGPSAGNPQANTMNSFQFADDLLIQRISHTLKLGFDVRRYRWDVFGSVSKSGEWAFNSLSSFLRGGPEGTTLKVTLPGSDNRKALRQTLLAFYVQDEYRARPNLQFNLGLRYEYATIIHDRDGKTAFLRDPVHDADMQVGPYFADNPSHLNFSPRLGVRWSPRSNSQTVISAGFGIYYDQIIEYAVHQPRSTPPFFNRASRINFDASKTFPNALAAVSEIVPVKLIAETPDNLNSTNPMLLRYNFTLQQGFPAGWRAQASYVGARGNHLIRNNEVNEFPVPVVTAGGTLCFPPDKALVSPSSSFFNPSCPPVPTSLAGPINPAFGDIQWRPTDGQSFYNALQLSINNSGSRGLSLQVSYTYSKSVDDASAISGAGIQYPLMRTLDRGLSDFDLRHRFTTSYFYTFPVGSGRRWLNSGILSHVFGGWRLGGILSFRTGAPFSPQINVRTPGYLFSASRPNLLPGQSNNPVLGGADRYFDPAAFTVPARGTLGNVGRNTIIAASVFTVDVSLQKEFMIDGKRRLQFRAEFFNLPNHTNLDRVNQSGLVVFSGASGRPNPTAGKIGGTATTARQVQFALRFSF